jgi:ABC-type glycerol-3-phosphate transport system permease component
MTALRLPLTHSRARRRGGREVRGRAPWWLYVLLVLGMVAMIGPFVWMLLGAFKTQPEFLRTTPKLLPERWTLDNFDRLFAKQVRALLRQLGGRGRRGHGRQPAVLLDGGLRAREAALRR